jgi:hypothetical protein
MDYAVNVVVKSLLGEDNGQFSKTLSGLGERVKDNSTLPTEQNESESDDESIAVEEKCRVCDKSCHTPNSLANKEIVKCINLLKNSETTGHYLRDNLTASTNLDDYLRPSIWCWHPQRLSPLKPLRCWNESCPGHSGEVTSIISYNKSVNN